MDINAICFLDSRPRASQRGPPVGKPILIENCLTVPHPLPFFETIIHIEVDDVHHFQKAQHSHFFWQILEIVRHSILVRTKQMVDPSWQTAMSSPPPGSYCIPCHKCTTNNIFATYNMSCKENILDTRVIFGSL